jgi:hypothetical protein
MIDEPFSQRCSVGDTTPDYGYGDTAAPDTAKVRCVSTDSDDLGYGNTHSNDQYGYGNDNDQQQEQQRRRERPRRRGSITKYSLDAQHEVQQEYQAQQLHAAPPEVKEIHFDATSMGYGEGVMALHDDPATPDGRIRKSRKSDAADTSNTSPDKYGYGDTSNTSPDKYGYGDTSNTPPDKYGYGDSRSEQGEQHTSKDDAWKMREAWKNQARSNSSSSGDRRGGGHRRTPGRTGSKGDIAGTSNTPPDIYGYGDTSNTSADKYSYGDTNDLGYGDTNAHGSTASGQSTDSQRHRPRRRGSITKYSLEATKTVADEYQDQVAPPLEQEYQEHSRPMSTEDSSMSHHDGSKNCDGDAVCHDGDDGDTEDGKKKKKKGKLFSRLRIGKSLSQSSKDSSSKNSN